MNNARTEIPATSKTINVLHLRDTDKICGPGKTILETASRIDRSRFALTIGIFARPHETTNAYYDAVLKRGVMAVRIPSLSKFDVKTVSTIARIIRERDIHVVHSHEYKSDILTFLLRRRLDIPIVTTVHGWITNSIKSKLYVALNKRVLRYFDRVIAVSPRIRDEVLANGVAPENVQLIHNAIVMENYQRHLATQGEFRAQFGLSQDAFVVAAVGRLSPEKGQADLLRASAPLMRSYRRLHVALVGDGPDRDRLRSVVLELGIADRVVFTGHLVDVRPVFRDTDLLALTSYTEGFPNVILEALSMEVPVVATDVGGVPDIVENGVTGALVPAGDISGIARAIEHTLQDPQWARQTALQGQARVAAQFQFARRVEKVQQLYREVMAGRKGNPLASEDNECRNRAGAHNDA